MDTSDTHQQHGTNGHDGFIQKFRQPPAACTKLVHRPVGGFLSDFYACYQLTDLSTQFYFSFHLPLYTDSGGGGRVIPSPVGPSPTPCHSGLSPLACPFSQGLLFLPFLHIFGAPLTLAQSPPCLIGAPEIGADMGSDITPLALAYGMGSKDT